MPYYKFGPKDILKNRVKAYPDNTFFVHSASVYYNNKNSYLRWDFDFIKLQMSDTEEGESTLNFLVPQSWGNTYNARTSGRTLDQLYDEYKEDRYRCSPLLRRMEKVNAKFFD